jgi:DNA-binding FrmR family transcriptional regulator
MEFVDDEICQNMLDALGAVAGAVNGVAGGIFSLLSFACQ